MKANNLFCGGSGLPGTAARAERCRVCGGVLHSLRWLAIVVVAVCVAMWLCGCAGLTGTITTPYGAATSDGKTVNVVATVPAKPLGKLGVNPSDSGGGR